MTALTYFDLFNELGGQHSTEMWILLWLRAAFAIVGIVLNSLLLWATFKSNHLRSICNRLIALDTLMLALFHLNTLVTFGIALAGINLVPLSTCFYMQALSMFGLLMAFQVMLLIGVERLANVLFPLWSRQFSSKLLHLAFLVFSLVGVSYLLWLDYLECHNLRTPVFCFINDVTSLGTFYAIAFTRTLILHGLLLAVYASLWVLVKHKNPQSLQAFSKNLFNSLLGLVLVELLGWLPSIFLAKMIQWLQLSPLQSSYVVAAFGVITGLTASANMPMLFAFSRTYRLAIFEVLAKLGWRRSQIANAKKSGIQAWAVPAVQ